MGDVEPRYYVLGPDGKTPVPATLEQWAQLFGDTSRRRVAHDTIGGVWISTVFLGLDHNHWGKGPPILFETMIFDGMDETYQTRCSTWDEAMTMHRRAAALARKGYAMAELKLEMARSPKPRT